MSILVMIMSPMFNMKEHELTITEPNLKTELVTSVTSYMYVCPICKEQRRYAIPPKGQEVFCNGLDFGTKVPLKDLILEVGEAEYIKEVFVTWNGATPDSDKLYITDKLDDLGFLSLVKDGYELTEKGAAILAELKQLDSNVSEIGVQPEEITKPK